LFQHQCEVAGIAAMLEEGLSQAASYSVLRNSASTGNTHEAAELAQIDATVDAQYLTS
jgi:hypothetical protein